MNLNHISLTQRLTISLPGYLYDQLIRRTKSGKISSFIARLLEKELVASHKLNLIDDFFTLRANLPRKSSKQIKEVISRGRL